MSRLFIIGNGFDMAHGIPTKYSDFRDYLHKTYPNASEEDAFVPECTIGHHGEAVFDDDQVVGYLLMLLSRNIEKDWKDFEASLGRLDFDDDYDMLPEVFDRDGDRNLWHEAYNNEDLTSQLVECVPMILDLFSEWVATIDISHKCPKKQFSNLIDTSEDLFLTFNYTPTLEYLYGVQNVCHIHGIAGGKVVVGHGEGPRYTEDHMSPYIGSEDGIESIQDALRKDTDRAIEENWAFFQGLSSGLSAIYSFGFSFSKVDRPYLQEICRIVDTSSVTWFFNDYNSADERKSFQDTLRACGFKGTFAVFSC